MHLDYTLKPFLILVADDDADVRESVRLVLESDGYTTLGAANGEEALALARARRPHLVLLDVIMPVRSGLDVLEEKARDAAIAGIPVIAITALGGNVPQGAVAVLRKPFDLEHILRIVRDHCT